MSTYSESRIEAAARAAHNANVIFSRSHHETKPLWDDLPEDQAWMKADTIKRAEAIARGETPADPAAEHEVWVTGKVAGGWILGPVKDSAAKTHPSLVPYEKLPLAEQLKDHLLVVTLCSVLGQPIPPAFR